jgi:hypothetical protein
VRLRRTVFAPVAVLAVTLLAGCVFLPFIPPPPERPTGPDVQDFTFESFDARYELGRDENGVSTLTTTEHLVALFPEYDQNRGIERWLFDRVADQDTDLEVVSVTDGAGEPIEFEVTDDGGPIVSVVMAGDEFVHGRQEYVVVYTQRNVITEEGGVEYFHWGVNGSGWSQPFAAVSARIELADGLAAGLTDRSGCYVDSTVAQRPCDLVQDGDVISATVEDVAGGESVTLQLQFERQFEVE